MKFFSYIKSFFDDSLNPVPGEIWIFDDDLKLDSPWPINNLNEFLCVKILDVKQGWVKYYTGSINIMKLTEFMYFYTKVTNPPKDLYSNINC